MFIVFLYFVQIITGFALYGQFHPGGFWWNLTNWMFVLASSQTMRLVHHLIMYLLIAFAIHHIYSAWLVDTAEGNGTMSSIFSGFKFLPCNQGPDCIQRVRRIRTQSLGRFGRTARSEPVPVVPTAETEEATT
jgi:Ni/Fe-hydrogenase 1 B-type cytochrome subunit